MPMNRSQLEKPSEFEEVPAVDELEECPAHEECPPDRSRSGAPSRARSLGQKGPSCSPEPKPQQGLNDFVFTAATAAGANQGLCIDRLPGAQVLRARSPASKQRRQQSPPAGGDFPGPRREDSLPIVPAANLPPSAARSFSPGEPVKLPKLASPGGLPLAATCNGAVPMDFATWAKSREPTSPCAPTPKVSQQPPTSPKVCPFHLPAAAAATPKAAPPPVPVSPKASPSFPATPKEPGALPSKAIPPTLPAAETGARLPSDAPTETSPSPQAAATWQAALPTLMEPSPQCPKPPEAPTPMRPSPRKVQIKVEMGHLGAALAEAPAIGAAEAAHVEPKATLLERRPIAASPRAEQKPFETFAPLPKAEERAGTTFESPNSFAGGAGEAAGGQDAGGPQVSSEDLSQAEIASILAEAFERKCGTLERAFKWFDFNSRGRISRSQWENGMKLGRFHLPLANLKPSKIFGMLSGGAGDVTPAAWEHFFDIKPKESAEEQQVVAIEAGAARPVLGGQAAVAGSHRGTVPPVPGRRRAAEPQGAGGQKGGSGNMPPGQPGAPGGPLGAAGTTPPGQAGGAGCQLQGIPGATGPMPEGQLSAARVPQGQTGAAQPMPPTGTAGQLPQTGAAGQLQQTGAGGPMPRTGTGGPKPQTGTAGPMPQTSTLGPMPQAGTAGQLKQTSEAGTQSPAQSAASTPGTAGSQPAGGSPDQTSAKSSSLQSERLSGASQTSGSDGSGGSEESDGEEHDAKAGVSDYNPKLLEILEKDMGGFVGDCLEEFVVSFNDPVSMVPQVSMQRRVSLTMKRITFVDPVSPASKRRISFDDSAVGLAVGFGEDPSCPGLPQLGDVISQLAEQLLREEAPKVVAATLRASLKSACLPNTSSVRAEAMAIEVEIMKLGIRGPKALAYILAAKCGSLDAAFKWLDFLRRGAFSQVQWQTAIAVLHVDVHAITGLKPQEIFIAMRKLGKTPGRVSKKAWRKYFDKYLTAEDYLALSRFRKTICHEARQQLRSILGLDPSAGNHRKGFANGSADGADGQQKGITSNSAQGGDWAAGDQQLQGDSDGGGSAYWDQMKGASAHGKGPKVKWWTDSEGTGLGGAMEQGRDANSRRWGLTGQCAPEGPEVQRFRELFANMSPDMILDLGILTPEERAAVRQVAQELGLWSTGLDSEDGRVVVLQMGAKAVEIQQQLSAMKCGETLKMEGLSETMLFFAKTEAKRMGMWIRPDSERGTLEVMSLKGSLEDFVISIREQAMKLKEFDTFEMPAELSAVQRAEVEFMANKLHLAFMVREDGTCVVGKLNEFENQLGDILDGLQAGESRLVKPTSVAPQLLKRPAGCQALAALLVMEVAKAKGLDTSMTVTNAFQVTRPKAFVRQLKGKAAGADGSAPPKDQASQGAGTVTRSDSDLDAIPDWDDDTLASKISEAFDELATGTHGRNKYLRRSDLQAMAEAIGNRRKKWTVDAVYPIIELIFEETLELQVDMGCKVRVGLSLESFRVFLSKTAYKIGWAVTSLLIHVMNWFES